MHTHLACSDRRWGEQLYEHLRWQQIEPYFFFCSRKHSSHYLLERLIYYISSISLISCRLSFFSSYMSTVITDKRNKFKRLIISLRSTTLYCSILVLVIPYRINGSLLSWHSPRESVRREVFIGPVNRRQL